MTMTGERRIRLGVWPALLLWVAAAVLIVAGFASAQTDCRLGAPCAVAKSGHLTSIDEMVRQALAANPRLGKLQQQVRAAYERVPQIRSLPDPMLSTSVFASPIETAAGSQRANLTVAQKIPWIHRLNAQGQQAAVYAQALEQNLAAESLLLVAQVRMAAYQLYLIEQKIRINKTNQTLLRGLTEVALGRVRVGKAGQGDVSRGTLELSRLQAELLALEYGRNSTKAKLNELLNRQAEAPLPVVGELGIAVRANWTLPALRELAYNNQPALVSARLRQEAAQLGIQIAHLQQVPDLTLNVSTFFMEGNRPPSRIVNVGQDAWAAGVSINIPLWRGKYHAMQREATHRFHAAAFDVQHLLRRYDAAIADGLAKVHSAERTVAIYKRAILQQARQTLFADQQALQQGKVEFDRVITDFHNVLKAETGYHQAKTDLATALARLEQLVGVPLQHSHLEHRSAAGLNHGAASRERNDKLRK